MLSLDLAIRERQEEACSILLEAGPPANETALIEAIKKGQGNSVELLLEHGADALRAARWTGSEENTIVTDTMGRRLDAYRMVNAVAEQEILRARVDQIDMEKPAEQPATQPPTVVRRRRAL